MTRATLLAYGSQHHRGRTHHSTPTAPTARQPAGLLMPRYQVCPTQGCGQIRPIGGDCPAGHRAQAQATARDNQRRAARQRAHGSDLAHWRKVRRLAILEQRACQACGTTLDLTAHLDPAMAGDHRAATPDDITVLCRRCHGRVDQPRSLTGGRSR